MTTINTGIPIDQPGVRAIDTSKLKLIKEGDEEYAHISEAINKAKQTFSASGSIEELQQNEQAKTNYNTQAIAQETASTETTSEGNRSQAATEFLEYMSLSTEEKIFQAILKEMDITQEEYDALPPEEQEKIAQEVRDRIIDKIEQSLASA